MDIEATLDHRRERDHFFAEHYASPLPEVDQAMFRGLAYFAPDPNWDLPVAFTPSAPVKIPITSTVGTESAYEMVGTAEVVIAGATYQLTVLDDGDGNAFIPFADDTSGDETYVGGRYVDLTISDDGRAAIDFNQARNPWCVYDEEFVCPLPPPENRIATRITAGEMTYTPPA